ncbi:MAG: SNF2-related protein [Blastocatellia bacterium]|nr:SNF2-related protein [Blastocatellia bacterium]
MEENQKLSTLIDNLAENTVLNALKQLLLHTTSWDIATGYFEIGSLLALDGFWQHLEQTRILMGDETTRRTRQELLNSLQSYSETNIETIKERDDAIALTGLKAIRQALANKKIQVKIYSRAKFHAKAYHLKTGSQPIDYALIGSSNFTEPGLLRNLELNLFTTDSSQIAALKAWYERVWDEAEDVNAEILKLIERHLRAFTPFEVWAKALYEYFAGREAPITDWERNESVMYPLLSHYQQDGYRAARQLAETWRGAFICDGVGLGKTFIGLMLLEYHLNRGHHILLVVPKSARASVWERNLKRFIQPHYGRALRQLVEIRNHTDFGRPGTISDEDLDYYRSFTDVILIDEAHHFRTPSSNRSRTLSSILDDNKQCYFLTATPINNSLLDLYHLINFLARNRQDRFASLGIQNLRRYFGEAEKKLETQMAASLATATPDVQTAAQEADILRTDQLLKALVIQRSRAYVVDSEKSNSDSSIPTFPERQKPQVIKYSLKKVYSGLYTQIASAFDKDNPLLSLAVYNSELFRKGDIDTFLLNRDKQVIGLIRTLLLKRLESSYKAFEGSLEELLRKMAYFLSQHDPEKWEAWKNLHSDAWQTVQEHRKERRADDDLDAEEEEENDFDDDEFLIRSLDPERYDLDRLLPLVIEDMTLIVKLLRGVHNNLSPDTDDKLKKLVAALRDDPQLKDSKVVVFTEFKDTARYLWRNLQANGFANVEELDSTRKIDRENVIKRFAPYYNCTEEELSQYTSQPIRILISTDVLSEGLNLQDSNLIINYDLHWNPVRLMQRIGRVDRRLDPTVERALGRNIQQGDNKVFVYNFLPPDELEELLRLFKRVTGKLLRISKTLGIESPVLTPDEGFAALRLFNEQYLGRKSIEELMHEELNAVRDDHPALYDELPRFPKRVFSGKRAAEDATCGLFCAYRFPSVKPDTQGELRWYFRVAATGEVWESNRLEDIAKAIRSQPDTPRVTSASDDELKSWRREIEQKHVSRTLRDLNAPQGSRAALVCWMEVC